MTKGIIKSSLIISMAVLFLFVSPSARNAYPASDDFVRFHKAKENFRKGTLFFNDHKYLAAVEFFRRAVSEYPDYSTAREYLARSYRLAGFIDESLKEWEILADMNTSNTAINSRIDTIRFRQAHGSDIIAPGKYVLSSEYASSSMKMYKFRHPTDLAVDREKNVYITSFPSGKLVKLDQNGNGITTISPTIDGRLYGVDCRNDRLVVSDFKNDKIYIMNTDCKIMKAFGSHGSKDGQFHGPEGVCFDSDGGIYVVDNGNHRVQKFNEDGAFILKFGEQGEYEGNLNSPSDIAIAGKTVYVTDTGNHRLANFDDSGNFIRNISIEKLTKPRGIRNYNKSLLISDETNGLLVYEPETGSTEWFSSWDDGKRSFSKLFSAAIDREGFLYCLDYNSESALVFSPLQIRYTNLDIEITSIDTRKYPYVAIYANIRGRGGAPIYGLNSSNIKITEDGSNIQSLYVDYLREMNPSASMVLCIDRSDTAAGHHSDLPWASEFVLRKMRRNDAIKVMNFNSDSWTGSAFDWSRRRTLAAVRKTGYDKGKNIGAVLYNAITELLPKTNRRGVILLTDGTVADDSFQKYSARYVIEYAKSHYVPIYVIALGKRDHVLEMIASETGGAFYMASDVDGLKSIYDSIKRSEEYRYVLIYHSFKLPSFRGWWSDVTIEVNHKGQFGSEWGGYFVPKRN